MKVSNALVLAAATLVLCFALIACGGSGGSAGPGGGAKKGFSFDHNTLNCKSDSLMISTDNNAQFDAGTTVTFRNKVSGATFDGSAALFGGDLSCGFPSSAPQGTYDVLVQSPGDVQVNAGLITYHAESC